MADVNTDLITRTFDTVNPNVARVTQDRNAFDTELKCNNLAGWPNGETMHFSTYKLDTENEVIDDSQIDWKGIINQSTHTITNLKRVAGAPDGGSDVNDVVEAMPTAKYADELAQALLKTHEKNGDLKNSIVKADNIAIAAVTTGKIANGAVTTDTLADSAVTPEKRSGGFKIGFIPGSTFGTAGVKTISGLGFKPKLVKFFLQYDSTTASRMSTGAMTETDQHVETFVTSGSAGSSTFSTSRCIGYINTGSTSFSMSAAYSSMDADGFKINVINATPTLGVAYEAYG